MTKYSVVKNLSCNCSRIFWLSFINEETGSFLLTLSLNAARIGKNESETAVGTVVLFYYSSET